MRSYLRTATLLRRGISNLMFSRPLCASFEVTHRCNADCKHCHLGGRIQETRAPAERFGEVYRQIRPPVVMVSGGEPTIRGDLEDIMKAIRQPDGTPYMILTTNGAKLTREKFLRYRAIGLDQVGISLDFPDERHDEFRGIPGLFGRIRDFVQSLQPDERRAVTCLTTVQSSNYRELLKQAELARAWGVNQNYSPYTWMRTGDRGLVLHGEQLDEFTRVIEQLIAFRNQHDTIRTADSTLYDMVRFFRRETRPGCRAGERFMVVNPDATLSPCGLIIRRYATQKQMVEEFTRHNTCSDCNTCIRASTERPFNHFLMSGMRSVSA